MAGLCQYHLALISNLKAEGRCYFGFAQQACISFVLHMHSRLRSVGKLYLGSMRIDLGLPGGICCPPGGSSLSSISLQAGKLRLQLAFEGLMGEFHALRLHAACTVKSLSPLGGHMTSTFEWQAERTCRSTLRSCFRLVAT